MPTAPDCFQLVVGVLGKISFWYTGVLIWFFEFVSVCLFSLVSTNIGGVGALFNQNVVKWEFLVVKWYKVCTELEKPAVKWKREALDIKKRGTCEQVPLLYSHSVCA